MKSLYFDCFSGASGDMIIGALIALGVDIDDVRHELAQLDMGGYSIDAHQVERSHISGVKFDVDVEGRDHQHDQSHSGDHGHDHSQGHSHEHTHAEEYHTHSHEHRSLSTIVKMITGSGLKPTVKERAINIFNRLGEAEATVHNIPIEDVHFHEVGAIDSIVDIVGACIGFEILGIEQFVSSALNVGYGMVRCDHGLLPIPAPATARLLEGAPVYSRAGAEGEMVTPTGAAIISTLCESFGPMPAMKLIGSGFGAGSREIAGQPNMLRLVLGESADSEKHRHEKAHGDVVVIETNIDDVNPQVFGYLMEKLLAAGALDVYHIPVQMKKNRPGVLLSVVCTPDRLEQLSNFIFNETTTIGLRYYMAGRKVLAREIVEVETDYGSVRLKIARLEGKIINYSAEYDDCRAAAELNDVPLREVQVAAQRGFEALLESHK